MTNPSAEFALQTPSEERLAEEARPQAVTPLTLIRFLMGRRSAILDVAASPHALALGGVLVLSAGFAREYDGEDLLHEPWHLLIPHGASLLTAFLLYMLVRLTGIGKNQHLPTFFRGFPMFLRLYWMTAPLAWLYAIPFERWMSPGDATLWNLRLLGIVSVWRVVLMIRVISVVYGAAPLWRVISTVLLFGDAVMLIAIRFVPVPVLNLMGGVRMTESEQLLQTTTFLLQIVGFPSLFILLIMTLVPTAKPWTRMTFSQPSRVHGTTWLLAAISILIWRFILPVTQPEQQRRRVAEQLIMARDFPAAFMFMSKHDRADFPPHWSPPPHVAQPNPVPPINDLIEVLIQESPTEWVRAIFIEKFRNTTEQTLTRYGFVSDERLSSTLRILDRLPLSEWLPNDEWRRAEAVGFLRQLSSNSNRALSESDKACLLRILDKLPPQATTENQPTDQPTDPQSLDEAKSE
ncbi:MAG: hypothetical protein DWI00_03935 [Planctomycetota bacterium]|nr:MAG: hypothetical protein DWI00_03935 [Planctomycetota bacterium]